MQWLVQTVIPEPDTYGIYNIHLQRVVAPGVSGAWSIFQTGDPAVLHGLRQGDLLEIVVKRQPGV